MVTGQASNRAAGGAGTPISSATAQNLLNLLELSSSDLTTSMGENLPVTEMLRDTLISVLQNVRPDLFAHSQRVAFLCHGIARQCGWTSRKISTLVIAALLHEVGSIILPADFAFWDLTSTPIEEHSRRVTVDVLAACHADSELLEILILSQNFRYRNPQSTESDTPTPKHVLQGAAIFNFANLFDAVRHREDGKHNVAEIIAALKTLAETPDEQLVVEGMEEWLSGRDPQIEKFDLGDLQQGNLGMDEETLSIVHATFLEILFELSDLEEQFDGFFMLDATGRFLLWSYGCQNRLGKSMREMRNKHWTNQLMGYCNAEGLAFSDSQTPLYQTLETAKPAHLELCLKDPDENLIRTEVNTVPIMGRNGLLMGIVEIHRAKNEFEDEEQETPLTPEWIGDLVDTIHNLEDDADPIAEVPDLDAKYLVALEEKLGITGVSSPISPDAPERTNLADQVEQFDEEPYLELEANESSQDATAVEETRNDSDDAAEQEPSEEIANEVISEDVELEAGEEQAQQAEIDENSDVESIALDTDQDHPESTSPEDLDELFNRFDSLVTEEDLPEEDDEGSFPLSSESPAIDDEEAISYLEEEAASTEPTELSDETDSLELTESAPSDSIVEEEPTAEPAAETSELPEELTEEPESEETELEEAVADEEAVLDAPPEEFSVEDSPTEEEIDPVAEDSEPEIEDVASPEADQVEEPDLEMPEEPDLETETPTEDATDLAPPTESESDVEDVDEVAQAEETELEATVADEEAATDAPPEEFSVDDSSPEEEIAPVAEDSEPEIEDPAPVEDVASPEANQVEETDLEISEEPDLETETPAEDATDLAPPTESESEVDEVAQSEEAQPFEETDSTDEEHASAVEELAEEEAIAEPVVAEDVEEPAAEDVEEPGLKQTEEAAPPENTADDSAVPQTIEMPEQAQAPETTEVPSPESDQTDPSAQPVSREEWDAFVEHLINPNSPDHEPVSVLFLDVDHFKAINEGFGRQIGTDLLKEISRRLSQACGKRELSCRYGGEQFAIACPGIPLDKARKRGDQFRKLIDRTRFDVLPFHSLTVSVGITTYEEGDDFNELMNRAEHGLFQAKSKGRNCVFAVSSADIQAEIETAEETMSTLVTKDFEIETHFEAMIASDMIVYKLGGFLYDMHAKLLHVDRRHVSLRVGKKGFLPYWGRQDDDRPVLIDLELAEGWGKDLNTKGKLANTRINVRIRPDGWVRNQETFLTRAHFVLRELKGYFVTN